MVYSHICVRAPCDYTRKNAANAARERAWVERGCYRTENQALMEMDV